MKICPPKGKDRATAGHAFPNYECTPLAIATMMEIDFVTRLSGAHRRVRRPGLCERGLTENCKNYARKRLVLCGMFVFRGTDLLSICARGNRFVQMNEKLLIHVLDSIGALLRDTVIFSHLDQYLWLAAILTRFNPQLFASSSY